MLAAELVILFATSLCHSEAGGEAALLRGVTRSMSVLHNSKLEEQMSNAPCVQQLSSKVTSGCDESVRRCDESVIPDTAQVADVTKNKKRTDRHTKK